MSDLLYGAYNKEKKYFCRVDVLHCVCKYTMAIDAIIRLDDNTILI